MLVQEHMIERVRDLCRADDRLDAAMRYGSFAYGEGDAYSDIEFLLFFRDDAYAEIVPRTWIEQIAPVLTFYTNEYGIKSVIFDNLVRGEFHFHRAAEVAIAGSWRGLITFPSLDAVLIADKSGLLGPYLEAIIGPPPMRSGPEQVQFAADSFLNWWLFGVNVLRRGELARALELLNINHRELLKMARILEGTTAHFLTPSRLAEQDLSPGAYARLRDCSAALDGPALRRAYRQAWRWGRDLLAGLQARWPISVSEVLCARLDGLADGLEP